MSRDAPNRKRVRPDLLAVIALATFFPGCLSGWLYTNITLPIVVDMNETPIGEDVGELDNFEVRVRNITWADVQSRAIGDAAKRNGLRSVHYADEKTFSIFGGLFKQRTIQVWGDR